MTDSDHDSNAVSASALSGNQAGDLIQVFPSHSSGVYPDEDFFGPQGAGTLLVSNELQSKGLVRINGGGIDWIGDGMESNEL